MTANGVYGTTTTTELTLTFSADPSSLAVGDITVTGAIKGALTGTGTTRTLTISRITVADGANVTVAIANPNGFAITPASKTVAVNVKPATAVTFSGLTANGVSATTTSTALTLTFSADPTTLAVGDITVTGATKGSLTGTGTTRSLAISDITVANGANLTVAIANPDGFVITPASKTVAVNVGVPPTAVTFSGLTANGVSTTTSTTALTLTFSADPTSLAAGDITVTGATKGTLTGSGTTRTLAISAITVANGADVTVAIASPSGFAITPASKTVAVNVSATTAITFSNLTANGTSEVSSTTQLVLTFSATPTGITADNVTLTGATKSILTGYGTTRTLNISAITVANGQNLTVELSSPTGIAITPASKTVAVNVANDISLSSLTANVGTLCPVFDPKVTEYSIWAPNDQASISISATAAHSAATITSIYPAQPRALVAGPNAVVVTVKNGLREGSYTVIVYKNDVTPSDYSSANIGALKGVPKGTFQRKVYTIANDWVSVTVSPFRMSVKEITRAQFLAIMGADPVTNTNTFSSLYSSGTSDPALFINWYQAIAYCNKLSLAEGLTPVYAVTGVNFSGLAFSAIPTTNTSAWNSATATWTANGYRLPTEAEWMWAAMGARDGSSGYGKAFAGSTGTNSLGDYAWYAANTSITVYPWNRTQPVGTKLPNELGLYDMSGNAGEWVWDWYANLPDYNVTDYKGPINSPWASSQLFGSYGRVYRGGKMDSGTFSSTYDSTIELGVANRLCWTPFEMRGQNGFRVVRN